MNTFWKPKKTKVTSVRQSYWKQHKVPIFKQRNDDGRLGRPPIITQPVPGVPREGRPPISVLPMPNMPVPNNPSVPSKPMPQPKIPSAPSAPELPKFKAQPLPITPDTKYKMQPMPVTPDTKYKVQPLPITPDTTYKAQPLTSPGRQIPTSPKGTHWETIVSAKGGVERKVRVLVDNVTGKYVPGPMK